MFMNILALGEREVDPNHPIKFDVNVNRLSEPLLQITMGWIGNGEIARYTDPAGELWVSRDELANWAGFGHRLFDPDDAFHIPRKAMIRLPVLPYFTLLENPYPDRRSTAADYMAALSAEMPPRPYNFYIHSAWTRTPIVDAIRAGKIEAFPSEFDWSVSEDQARKFLPTGESFDDPTSPWYVDKHDRCDHDEIERLIAI